MDALRRTVGKPITTVIAIVVVLFAAGVSPTSTQAHPHVWIDAVAEMMFDEFQNLDGIRVYWAFDEIYSTFAVEGLDTNGDGNFEPSELAALVAENIKNLRDFSYFTFVEVDGKPAAYGDVKEFGMRYLNGRLAMWFYVPLESPVDPRDAEVTFAMYDPTFYIDIELAEKEPIRVHGQMPQTCNHKIEETEAPSTSQTLSESAFQTLGPSSNYGAAYAQWVRLSCGPAS